MRPTSSRPKPGDDVRGRHSEADIPKLLSEPTEIARREAANALAQFDALMHEIDKGVAKLASSGNYRLRPSTILNLHRLAVEGIDRFAGAYRPGSVTISRSHHVPPPAENVPELIEDLCDWVNDNLDDVPPVELAAHVLWQLCWIHPFTDGNGRTARAVSYLVLCVAYQMRLPGSYTIAEQISEDRRPYYAALEAADKVMEDTGAPDVSVMAAYLEDLVRAQLKAAQNTGIAS